METRRLGRTGHLSAVAVLGAAAFARATQAETETGLRDALAAGVNHLDVAPRYGDAERLLGPLLPAVRDRLFVGCKTTRHNPDGVRAQLEASLATLGCQRFDLYQLHGVTDRAELDTVMFPVNPRLWADPQYRRDAEELLALAAERDVGVMAIKAAAARPWHSPDPTERWATTWYEPYRDPDAVARGVRFALSVPGVHAICTPGDLGLLRAALSAAGTFTSLSPVERERASGEVAHEELIFPMPRA
jgi:hypothetical protein